MQANTGLATLKIYNHIGWFGAATTVAFIGAIAVINLTSNAGVHVVSQKGRQFGIESIEIAKGDTIRIVNDDGRLRHHAFVHSDIFSFDSGDQEPGSSANIVFSIPGDFNILCGIHPKMKMAVHVK